MLSKVLLAISALLVALFVTHTALVRHEYVEQRNSAEKTRALLNTEEGKLKAEGEVLLLSNLHKAVEWDDHLTAKLSRKVDESAAATAGVALLCGLCCGFAYRS